MKSVKEILDEYAESRDPKKFEELKNAFAEEIRRAASEIDDDRFKQNFFDAADRIEAAEDEEELKTRIIEYIDLVDSLVNEIKTKVLGDPDVGS